MTSTISDNDIAGHRDSCIDRSIVEKVIVRQVDRVDDFEVGWKEDGHLRPCRVGEGARVRLVGTDRGDVGGGPSHRHAGRDAE